MKRKIGVLLIILSVALIGAGGYLYFNSPKRIMLKAIANEFKAFQNKSLFGEFDKAQYTTNAELKVDDQVLATINGDMYQNTINSKYYLNYIIKYFDEYSSEQTISPEIYFENDKLYFKLKEVFADVFYIDITGEEYESMVTKEELDELISLLKETIVEELKESSFSKSNKKAQILEKNIDAERYSLSLTNVDLYDIFEGLITGIEKSKKLPVIKKNLFTDMTKDEYLKEFKGGLIEDYDKNTKLFEYNIYLKDDEIIKKEFIIHGEGETIDIASGAYKKSGGVYDYEFYVRFAGEDIITATAISDNNNYKINANLAGMMILEGTIIDTEKNNSLNLNLYNATDKSVPLFTINYEYKELEANKSYQTSLNFDVNTGENKISFVSSTNITCDKEVPKFDTSQAKKFNPQDLTGNTNDLDYDFSL